jgi:hypothetical protein
MAFERKVVRLTEVASVDHTEARSSQYNVVEKWFRIDEKT